jgi:hypothetical protein
MGRGERVRESQRQEAHKEGELIGELWLHTPRELFVTLCKVFRSTSMIIILCTVHNKLQGKVLYHTAIRMINDQ